MPPAQSEVDYINAHGTSTPPGDICETRAIKTVFGDHAKKSRHQFNQVETGHMLGGAGAVEMAICAKAIQTESRPRSTSKSPTRSATSITCRTWLAK